MKPREKKPDIVYRIINTDNGCVEGSYSRSCCTEYDFESVEEARCSRFDGIFRDENKYKIVKYRVTYELIEEGD